MNIFNYQGKHFPTGNRIFPPLQRSPINNFTVKGPGRTHKGAHRFPSSRRAEAPRPPTPPPGHLPLLFLECDPLAFPTALRSKSIWSARGRVRPQSTTQEVVMIKSSLEDQRKASGCRLFSSTSSQRSRGEELGGALSVAVLCYGVPIGVLVLHALG